MGVRHGLTLFLGMLLALLPATGVEAASAERELAFRDNFYDVEIRGKLVWIVGYHGTVLHSRDGGLSWTVQGSGTKEALFRVSFVDPRKGWISGSYGTLLHTGDGGRKWLVQQAPTTEHLFGLNFLDERTGWVVGSRGTVLYTETGGKTWLDRSIGEDVILNDVAFVDPGEGWAVGEFGRIYHTRDGGQSWTKENSPIEVSFISGENRNFFRLLLARANGGSLLNGWAFGLDGVIVGTKNGSHWEIVHRNGGTNPVATAHHLFDAAIFNGRKWAVGERGTVVFAPMENEAWTPAGLDTPPISLNGIAFGPHGQGLIVGNRGILFRTEDGGKQWKRIRIISHGPGKGISKVQ